MMDDAVSAVKSRTSSARKWLLDLMGLAEGEQVLDGVDKARNGMVRQSGMQAA